VNQPKACADRLHFLYDPDPEHEELLESLGHLEMLGEMQDQQAMKTDDFLRILEEGSQSSLPPGYRPYELRRYPVVACIRYPFDHLTLKVPWKGTQGPLDGDRCEVHSLQVRSPPLVSGELPP